jgi:hypothetical protein
VACRSETSDTAKAYVQHLPETPVIGMSAATVCEGADMVFYVSNIQPGVAYTWGGDKGVATGTGNCSYTVSGDSTGTKIVTVLSTVSLDGAMCLSEFSDFKSGYVQQPPATPAIMVSAATVCQNAPLTFYVPSPTTGIYLWDASDGVPDGSSYTFNTATAGAKTATVYVQLTDGGAICQSEASDRAAATVIAAPEAPSITGGGEQCGGTRSLSAASADSGANIRWTDGATDNPREAGSGTYYAVIVSANGCESARTPATVTIHPVPSISRTDGSTGRTATVLLNTPAAQITYYVPNATGVQWTLSGSLPSGVSGGTSTAGYTIDHAPSAAGSYSFSLTATTEEACSATLAQTITVILPEDAFASTRTWNINGDTWSDDVSYAPADCHPAKTFAQHNPAVEPVYVRDGNRYYYSYACMASVCPHGWAAPTLDQLMALKNYNPYRDLSPTWSSTGRFVENAVTDPSAIYLLTYSQPWVGINSNGGIFKIYYPTEQTGGYSMRCVMK